jgi:hypothetical protein
VTKPERNRRWNRFVSMYPMKCSMTSRHAEGLAETGSLARRPIVLSSRHADSIRSEGVPEAQLKPG